MQLIRIALFLAPLLAGVSAAVDDAPLNVQAKIKRDNDHMSRDEYHMSRGGVTANVAGLEKRACEKNGCKCAKNTPQGAYCGLCEEVTESGKGGFYTRDIFECSPSGSCCSYGSATVCKSGNYAVACPRVD